MSSFIDYVNFGHEVRASRALLGLTKEGLAKATNLAPATITRLEDGGGEPGTNAAVVVQNYLERAGIEFLEGTFGVAVALRQKPGEPDVVVGVTSDMSMPSGTRFMWPR